MAITKKEKLKKEQLNTLVFVALGEASMCWSKAPKGEFNSDKALLVGNKLVEDIENLFNLPE